jgi:hypothetical protein
MKRGFASFATGISILDPLVKTLTVVKSDIQADFTNSTSVLQAIQNTITLSGEIK